MTRLALLLVTCAAALLPRDSRARYLEQWRADVLGAAEAGLSPLGVAFGALRVARVRKALLPIGVLALGLRLRESRRVSAVLVVMVLANLGGIFLLVV
ncbi:hypothetical protein [Saccharothrix variisporea]|uniref:Uncharacterized protein n=1 Tax=Saccharothrix variisporea TaxID=543527 RepID=A0A495XBW3_9PSEU|nr:hypothetical protein [Saccharothrix variisporea]RKT71991.1 hypothetical protein DFJ66_5293 [Saccharothrix variisporea]